jgi:cytochrome b
VFNDGWLINQPDFLQALHKYSTWGWLVLVSMHVTGVVAESILHKDNLIRAMITGCKRVPRKGEK